jgi:hypothetical protein
MTTISYKSFDVSKLKFTTPVEDAKNPNITAYQLMSFPRYLKDGKEVIPQIQGPWMTLNTYGFPSKLDKNGKPNLNRSGQALSDRERCDLKVPFDLNDPDSKKLYELLCAIDQKCEDEKEQIWGDKKKANAYKYQSLVRQPPPNPDAPDDAPAKPDYVKLKFDIDYKTNEMKSSVYLNADGDRKVVETPTLDDVQKYVRYKCEFRPVFALCKLFGGKSAGDDGKRKYGIGLKLKHIEVKPSEMNAQDEQEAFVDDDDEDEPVQRRQLIKETKEEKPVKASAKKVVEEEAEEEEEEEEKPAPKVVAKAASKTTKKVEVEEEEEEEEEEEKPAPKTAARRGRGARTSVV